MTNCIDMCPYADDNLECNGECKGKPEQFGILDDVDLERGAAPTLTVIDRDYILNGGW